MKKSVIIGILLNVMFCLSYAQAGQAIQLIPPDTTRGLPVMKALKVRASATDFDTVMLSDQDLSDLIWAANGINRPENGKRTAPSATNAQDVDIYVCLKQGTYLYDAKKHALGQVTEGDTRSLVASRQEFAAKAPVILLLVSDISRFKHGGDSLKLVWAAMDAGIVSQNIAVFCAATGLRTRPRAIMDLKKLKAALKLNETQYLMLNNPVSY
ncbi:MAG TPA: SagB/ThcOx family dehydrogenase [bacterium]